MKRPFSYPVSAVSLFLTSHSSWAIPQNFNEGTPHPTPHSKFISNSNNLENMLKPILIQAICANIYPIIATWCTHYAFDEFAHLLIPQIKVIVSKSLPEKSGMEDHFLKLGALMTFICASLTLSHLIALMNFLGRYS